MANFYSLLLDAASSQYASRANPANLNIAGNLTIQCYFKLTSLPSVYGDIYTLTSKYLDTGGGQRQYYFIIGTDNKPSFVYYNSSNQTTRFEFTNAIDSSWVGVHKHITAVITVATPTITFYVNGVAVAGTSTATDATSIRTDGAAAFTIGSLNSGASQIYFFNGKISQVRVWDKALSPSEVAANYNQILTTATNLVGNWQLDNDYTDKSGNGYDLTAYGSPIFVADSPFNGNIITAKANIYRPDAGGHNSHSIVLDSASSQYLKIDNFSDEYSDGGEYSPSISVRFKLNSLPAAGQKFTLSTLGNTGEAEADNIPIQLQINEYGEIVYTHEYGSGTDEVVTTSNMGLTTDTWYEISVFRVSENGKIAFYKGLTRTDYITYAHEFTGGSNSLKLVIGANLTEDGEFFDGKIDQFTINPYYLVGWESPILDLNELSLAIYSEPTSFWYFGTVWKFNYSFSSYVSHEEETSYKLTPINDPTFSTDVPFKAFINAKASICKNSSNIKNAGMISRGVRNTTYSVNLTHNTYINSDGNLIILFNHKFANTTIINAPAQGLQAKISYNGGQTFCDLEGREGSVSQIFPENIDKEYWNLYHFDSFLDSENNIYIILYAIYSNIYSTYKIKLLKLTYNPSSQTYSIGNTKNIFTSEDADVFGRMAIIKIGSTLYAFNSNFLSGRTPTAGIFYKYSNDDGTTWSEDISIDNIDATGFYCDFDVSVINDKLFLVFENKTDGTIEYTELTTTWSTPALFIDYPSSKIITYYSKIFDWKIGLNTASDQLGLANIDEDVITNYTFYNFHSSEGALATEYNNNIYLFYAFSISITTGAPVGINVRTLNEDGLGQEEQISYINDLNLNTNYLGVPPYIPDAWIAKGYYFIPIFYVNRDLNFILQKYPLSHALTAKAKIRKGRFTSASYNQITQLTTTGDSNLLPPDYFGKCFFRTSDGVLIHIGVNADYTINFIKSTDNGINWSAETEILDTNGYNPRKFSAYMKDDDIYFVGITADDVDGTNEKIVFRKLTYSSQDWSVGSAVNIATTPTELDTPKIVKIGGQIWVLYAAKYTSNYRIIYQTSSDNGATWDAIASISSIGSTLNKYYLSHLGIYNSYPFVLIWSESTTNLRKALWNGSSWTSITSTNELWAIGSANPQFCGALLDSNNKLNIAILKTTLDDNFSGRIIYSYAEIANAYLSAYPRATANYSGDYSYFYYFSYPRITMFERGENIIAIAAINNNAANKIDLWFGELSNNGGTPPISGFLTNTSSSAVIQDIIPLTENLPDNNTIPVIVQVGVGFSSTMFYGEIELIEVGENLINSKGNVKNFITGGLIKSKSNILPPTSFMNAVNATTRIVKGKLEVMWDGLSWTDETTYFISAQGSEELSGELGESIATEADFEVDNTTKRFSPESSSPIKSYLKPRIPIRFSVSFGSGGYYLRLFTGYIKTYKPNKLSGICNFHCFDNTQYILNKPSKSSIYTNQTADELIELLAQDAGLNNTQYNLEIGSNMPVAWFNDRYINPLMSDIAIAERGRVFFNHYGILEFWNRQHLSGIATATFRTLNKLNWLKNINYEISETAIKNRIVIQAKPRGVQPLQVVWNNKDPSLYNQYSETLLWIPARNTQNAYLEIADPCINWTQPEPDTDYIANTLADGSGVNKTDYITISTFYPWANTVFIIATNHSDQDIYFTKFQVRAEPLPVASYIEVEAKDQNSINEFGEQKLGPIENDFINDEDTAKAIVYEELYRRNNTKYNFKAEIIGDPLLTVGTVLLVEQEDATTSDYMINKLEWTLNEQSGFSQSLELVEPVTIPKKQEVLALANIVKYQTKTITAKSKIT